jgi:DNA-binding beta-propeller fold protein YncE
VRFLAVALASTLVVSVVLRIASGAAAPAWAREGIILVSLSGDSSVAMVSSETGATVATFPVSLGPHEIITSSDRRFAFVANAGSGPGGTPGRSVSLLDLTDRKTQRTFDLGPDYQIPHDVRVSRNNAILWIACAPARSVLEVDVKSGSVRKSWATKADGGWFVEVTPDGKKLYVPHLEGKSVTAIDRTTGAVRTVVDGGAMSGIDMRPDGREVWVVGHEQKRVHIISTATDKVIASVDLPAADFSRLTFTPDGRQALLIQGTRVALINVAKRQQVATIELASPGKVISVSPGGAYLAVSHPSDNRLSVVDIAARNVARSIPVGPAPDGVTWVR